MGKTLITLYDGNQKILDQTNSFRSGLLSEVIATERQSCPFKNFFLFLIWWWWWWWLLPACSDFDQGKQVDRESGKTLSVSGWQKCKFFLLSLLLHFLLGCLFFFFSFPQMSQTWQQCLGTADNSGREGTVVVQSPGLYHRAYIQLGTHAQDVQHHANDVGHSCYMLFLFQSSFSYLLFSYLLSFLFSVGPSVMTPRWWWRDKNRLSNINSQIGEITLMVAGPLLLLWCWQSAWTRNEVVQVGASVKVVVAV